MENDDSNNNNNNNIWNFIRVLSHLKALIKTMLDADNAVVQNYEKTVFI